MSDNTSKGLRELQRLDNEIRDAKAFLTDFDPLLAEVEEPALVLESEVGRTRSRLQEMQLEERRLEVTSGEKRIRLEKLTERLNLVRNVREEAAVNAELDMVRSALEADEQEALSLVDQIRRFELRLEEENSAWEAAKAEVEPKQQELIEKRDAAQSNLAEMEAKRSEYAGTLDTRVVKVYDAIHQGGKRAALADLTEDGACGLCYSMVPLQVQQEIRDGAALIRCEGCGVILIAPDPEALAAAAAEAEAAAAAAEAEEAATEDAGDDAADDAAEEAPEAEAASEE